MGYEKGISEHAMGLGSLRDRVRCTSDSRIVSELPSVPSEPPSVLSESYNDEKRINQVNLRVCVCVCVCVRARARVWSTRR